MKTIALHGATGTQGRHIAARLRAAGFTVRPLDSRTVDLVEAYTDADAVVVQLPLVFDPTAVTQAETVLAALAKAGVSTAVFNPAMPVPPEPVGVPFVDARVLLAAGLPSAVGNASVVGPAGPYLENLRQPWSLRRIRDLGEVAYPLPADIPMRWVALDDLGDAIAQAITRDATVTALAGPEEVTGDRVAAAIGAAAGRGAIGAAVGRGAIGAAVGRGVRWVYVPPAEYRDLLTPVIGAAAADGVALSYQHGALPPPPPPADVLRLAPTTVERWAAGQDWAA